ncbi:hypothetical protein GPALN_005771 [Globodera pallida]|nr:hypothetical protein GPALN_005771 [Globodera pallida]
MAIADPSISPLIAFLAFFVYAPLCLITLLLNLLSIAVLAHGHRYFSQKFFFIVGRHLLAADLLSTTAQLLVAVPVTVMATESAKNYLRSSFAQFVTTFETLAHLNTFHFVALQACAFLPCFQKERVAFRLNAYGSFISLVVWMLIAGQMLLFGFVPCAKRFDPLTLHFFDSCYWSSANQRGSGSALLNIWLSVLLCTAFFIYSTGLSHVRRQMSHLCNHNVCVRRKSISISVIMPSTIGQDGPSSVSPSSPNQLSPKRKEVLERKRLTELCRLHDLIVQGFLITMSLVVRFTGFFMLPWLASAMFGISTNAIDQRALVCVLANICILLSLVSHPLIYWWWNSRIRALTKEIVETLHKKLFKS